MKFVVASLLLGLGNLTLSQMKAVHVAYPRVGAVYLALIENPQFKHTRDQLGQKIGAKVMLSGGYFYPRQPGWVIVKRGGKKKRVWAWPEPVDYLKINGRVVNPNVFDPNRPIIASNRKTKRTAIFSSWRSYRKYQRYFDNALAGDHRGQEPAKRCWRVLVATKGNRLHGFVMWGNAAECRARMRRLGMTFSFLDSSTSAYPKALMPYYAGIAD